MNRKQSTSVRPAVALLALGMLLGCGGGGLSRQHENIKRYDARAKEFGEVHKSKEELQKALEAIQKLSDVKVNFDPRGVLTIKLKKPTFLSELESGGHTEVHRSKDRLTIVCGSRKGFQKAISGFSKHRNSPPTKRTGTSATFGPDGSGFNIVVKLEYIPDVFYGLLDDEWARPVVIQHFHFLPNDSVIPVILTQPLSGEDKRSLRDAGITVTKSTTKPGVLILTRDGELATEVITKDIHSGTAQEVGREIASTTLKKWQDARRYPAATPAGQRLQEKHALADVKVFSSLDGRFDKDCAVRIEIIESFLGGRTLSDNEKDALRKAWKYARKKKLTLEDVQKIRQILASGVKDSSMAAKIDKKLTMNDIIDLLMDTVAPGESLPKSMREIDPKHMTAIEAEWAWEHHYKKIVVHKMGRPLREDEEKRREKVSHADAPDIGPSTIIVHNESDKLIFVVLNDGSEGEDRETESGVKVKGRFIAPKDSATFKPHLFDYPTLHVWAVGSDNKPAEKTHSKIVGFIVPRKLQIKGYWYARKLHAHSISNISSLKRMQHVLSSLSEESHKALSQRHKALLMWRFRVLSALESNDDVRLHVFKQLLALPGMVPKGNSPAVLDTLAPLLDGIPRERWEWLDDRFPDTVAATAMLTIYPDLAAKARLAGEAGPRELHNVWTYLDPKWKEPFVSTLITLNSAGSARKFLQSFSGQPIPEGHVSVRVLHFFALVLKEQKTHLLKELGTDGFVDLSLREYLGTWGGKHLEARAKHGDDLPKETDGLKTYDRVVTPESWRTIWKRAETIERRCVTGAVAETVQSQLLRGPIEVALGRKVADALQSSMLLPYEARRWGTFWQYRRVKDLVAADPKNRHDVLFLVKKYPYQLKTYRLTNDDVRKLLASQDFMATVRKALTVKRGSEVDPILWTTKGVQ